MSDEKKKRFVHSEYRIPVWIGNDSRLNGTDMRLLWVFYTKQNRWGTSFCFTGRGKLAGMLSGYGKTLSVTDISKSKMKLKRLGYISKIGKRVVFLNPHAYLMFFLTPYRMKKYNLSDSDALGMIRDAAFSTEALAIWMEVFEPIIKAKHKTPPNAFRGIYRPLFDHFYRLFIKRFTNFDDTEKNGSSKSELR